MVSQLVFVSGFRRVAFPKDFPRRKAKTNDESPDGAHLFNWTSTATPLASRVSIILRRSTSNFLMYSIVPRSTIPSERARPSRPGTITDNRSNPCRICSRLFFSGSLKLLNEPFGNQAGIPPIRGNDFTMPALAAWNIPEAR